MLKSIADKITSRGRGAIARNHKGGANQPDTDTRRERDTKEEERGERMHQVRPSVREASAIDFFIFGNFFTQKLCVA
jgi:hypothetical protein